MYEDKDPGAFWAMEDAKAKAEAPGFNLSNFIPSAGSFDEAMDDLVLKACEGLEVADSGAVLCNDMMNDTMNGPPTEIYSSRKGTLDVGIREAIAIRKAEKTKKALGGESDHDEDHDEINLCAQLVPKSDHDETNWCAQFVPGYVAPDPPVEKAKNLENADNESKANSIDASEYSEGDYLSGANPKPEVGMRPKKKKTAKYTADKTTLKALETEIGQYIDMLNEDNEEQKKNEFLKKEIGEHIDMLKKQRARAKQQMREEPDEIGEEKIRQTDELIELWSLVQSNESKEEKKDELKKKIEEIEGNLQHAESNQLIWKILKDEDFKVSEYNLLKANSAPFPENMTKRVKQQEPETYDVRQARITKMFDDLDRRMAKAAGKRKGNKEDTFLEENFPIIAGCLDDLAVIKEVGAEFLEEDFGVKFGTGEEDAPLQIEEGTIKEEDQEEDQEEGEARDIDEAAASAIVKSSGIKAFLEDTRDALCDVPSPVIEETYNEGTSVAASAEAIESNIATAGTLSHLTQTEGPHDPPATSWFCFDVPAAAPMIENGQEEVPQIPEEVTNWGILTMTQEDGEKTKEVETSSPAQDPIEAWERVEDETPEVAKEAPKAAPAQNKYGLSIKAFLENDHGNDKEVEGSAAKPIVLDEERDVQEEQHLTEIVPCWSSE